VAVFGALAINSGQAVLDLDCGGGHLVRDVALAVNEAALWLDQLDTADIEGRYGFVSVFVLTTAIAATR
jgi:cyclopropane fatty-acyl-phospholipid synthase-like methyltransferase